jgi:hypothetical protein
VDTGAEISVYPVNKLRYRPAATEFQLHAANGSTITTFGFRAMDLNLGVRRQFTWKFIVAAVTHAIIGMDFLSHFNLVIDPRNKRLIDTQTSLSVRTVSTITATNPPRLLAVTDSIYLRLLKEFPQLTNPQQPEPPSNMTPCITFAPRQDLLSLVRLDEWTHTNCR